MSDGVGDDGPGISDVVGQIEDQLVDDRGDEGNSGLTHRDGQSQQAEELVDDGLAESRDLSPDTAQAEEVEDELGESLHGLGKSDLLLRQASFAQKERAHLSQSVGDEGESISSVVDQISVQLSEDRGDESDGSLTQEQDLSHDEEELVDDSLTEADNGFPDQGKRESQVVLNPADDEVGEEVEQSALGNWLLNSEGARGKAQCHKKSQHFYVFRFVFKVF